jgi:hypothetical protein
MARTDRIFTKLDLTYRSSLPEWYKKHLIETVPGFEGTRHVLWLHMRTEYGYPGHRVHGRLMPLNGYLLFKNDNWTLAGDETIVPVCGISICCQTAHMRVIQRPKKDVDK